MPHSVSVSCSKLSSHDAFLLGFRLQSFHLFLSMFFLFPLLQHLVLIHLSLLLQLHHKTTHIQDNKNNNNDDDDNVYGAVIVAESQQWWFIWWIWNGAKRPPTLSPGQTTRAVSPPVGCQKPHPPSPFIIITQLESWYSFYHPTEGRRLSRRRHCSKSEQPMPKAVHHSGFYIKHATAHGGIKTLVLSHRSH